MAGVRGASKQAGSVLIGKNRCVRRHWTARITPSQRGHSSASHWLPVDAARSQPSFPSRSNTGDETNKTLAGSAVSAAGPTAASGQYIPDYEVFEYEVFELLGQEGLESVWKTKHTRLKKFVALKILRPEKALDAAAAGLAALADLQDALPWRRITKSLVAEIVRFRSTEVSRLQRRVVGEARMKTKE